MKATLRLRTDESNLFAKLYNYDTISIVASLNVTKGIKISTNEEGNTIYKAISDFKLSFKGLDLMFYKGYYAILELK